MFNVFIQIFSRQSLSFLFVSPGMRCGARNYHDLCDIFFHTKYFSYFFNRRVAGGGNFSYFFASRCRHEARFSAGNSENIKRLSAESGSLALKATTGTNGRLMSSLCVPLTMTYRRPCQDHNLKQKTRSHI